jgi:predicted PolB exonuclease-like 3'-5' exonuclease
MRSRGLKMTNHIIVDIETAPIILIEEYFELSSKDKLSMLNPIDSRIVAIGVKIDGENYILIDKDEKIILDAFWKLIEMQSDDSKIIGFNILNFDLPFIISRCFNKNVKIMPLILKSDVIDIREQLNCFKYGAVKGTLKDYAHMCGIEKSDVDGGDVARLVFEEQYDKISEYLSLDLDMTEALYNRCKALNITQIKRW